MEDVKKTAEELRAELANAEKGSEVSSDSAYNSNDVILGRIGKLEIETQANAEAVVGLGDIENKHNNENILLFFTLMCGYCLTVVIIKRLGKEIDSIRTSQESLLIDVADLAKKVSDD